MLECCQIMFCTHRDRVRCFIVPSVVNDCLVLSQMFCIMAAFYLLHPWSCLAIKAPSFSIKALPFGGMLYSVGFVLK